MSIRIIVVDDHNILRDGLCSLIEKEKGLEVVGVCKTKVIALSVHSDKRFVTEMIKAGASGYLLKDCAFEELVRAIFAVNNNQIYLSSSITDVVIKDYLNRVSENESRDTDVLTSREREILQLIAEGLATRIVASRLNISFKTVETHRRNIMEKLNLRSVAELTKYAIREGLTSV
ncbi:MAG: response regulator transcription factor [Pseudomonadota bacterium]